MNVFICCPTDRGNHSSPPDRQLFKKRVRKRYPPCHSDGDLTVFCSDQTLEQVARVLNDMADSFQVGCITVQITPESTTSHGFEMSKCFDEVISNRIVDATRNRGVMSNES